jgi:dTMP kinase
MRQLSKGFLLSIEGIDGSGKSTLAQQLMQALNQQQFPVLLTKEPGDTPLGQYLRTLVQEKRVPICSKAEFLLFAADRAQHFQDCIIPALEQKKIIISDRLADSSLVYQGYGRGLSLEMIQSINEWAMNVIQPDLVIYLKITADTAAQRIAKRNLALSSFEKEKQTFINALIQGFDTIFIHRKNVITINAHQSMEQVTAQTFNSISSWMKQQQIIN